MSLIKNFFTGTTVGKGIAKGLDTLSGIVTNPITAITKGTKASTEKFLNANPLTNTVKTITNVGLVAAGVYAGGAIAAGEGAALASKAVTLIPKTIKGKAAAGTGALLLGGAFISEPAKTGEAVLTAPSSIANVGGNIANLIAEPSLASAKAIFTENPIAAGSLVGAGVVAAGVGGLAVANTYSNYQNTEAIKENTKATLGVAPTNIVQQEATPMTTLPYTPELEPDVGSPLAPSDEILPSAATGDKPRKRRKTTKKVASQNINQKVYVYNDGEKHIKRRIACK